MTTILLIEDEAELREETALILQFEGFQTLTAENGRIGVQMAEQHLPDVIVSDITMDEMDGYAVLQHLRLDPVTADIPVLFLTARADRSFVRHGMELGADDYITKPFSVHELVSAIRARLERSANVEQRISDSVALLQRKVARTVAHELRTPLISIQFVKDIIERQLSQLSPAEIQEMLETLGEGANRLNHLVEQTVLMTYLDSNSLSAQSIYQSGMATPLWTITTAAVDMARHFAFRNRDCTLHTQIRDQDALVQTNTHALRHALAEIMANAFNFAATSVTLAQWAADGWCYTTVMDDGPGMPPEVVIHLGSDFFQHRRDVQEQQGMGLGLALARRIIAVHGGVLDISSVEGRGTQITVKLPQVG